ncbi:biotin transporter BioY [Bradyrhizobium sp. WD16]|uniref:biotin transporter BioY n=1 Tax=Bradyrhizobium sp. WD16 TaxID=1521768 RepID=UPI0020A44F9E|nr:biotin transporter BioY [Bradyrhizobium sp. WD16]UTD29338.1 biotin transporter BioY [Bradyrhizobium sp. WD16]
MHSAAGALARNAILVLAGSALLALSAKINVPLPYVPMTMQSLVVLLIGAAYGWRLGLATLLAYLGEGAAGLPVFAGPVGGPAVFAGPTAGYLVGFVLAAVLMGVIVERMGRSVAVLGVGMLAGHAVMLAAGFAWLVGGLGLGAEKAWLVGVVPFVAGSVIKSALGALGLPLLHRSTERLSRR